MNAGGEPPHVSEGAAGAGRSYLLATHWEENEAQPLCLTLFQLHDSEAAARISGARLGWPHMQWIRPGQWCVAGEVMLSEVEDQAAAVEAFVVKLNDAGITWKWSSDLLPEMEGGERTRPVHNTYASLDSLRAACAAVKK